MACFGAETRSAAFDWSLGRPPPSFDLRRCCNKRASLRRHPFPPASPILQLKHASDSALRLIQLAPLNRQTPGAYLRILSPFRPYSLTAWPVPFRERLD